MSTDGTYDHRSTIGPEGYSEQVTLPPVDRLRGMDVRDRSGERIGTVTDTYAQPGGSHGRQVAVKTGSFDTADVVPVDDLRVEGRGAYEYLALRYDRDRLRDAAADEPG
jgi:hypothetical protein